MTVSAVNTAGRPRTPIRRFRTAAIGFATIAVALLAIVILTGARRLRPDEIVREVGAYNSPGNRFRVVVAESDQRTVTFTLVSPRPWKRVTAILDNGRPLPAVVELEVERDWFLCFDEYDRLWLFVGPWDRDSGPLRQLPSGGTGGYTQHVMMFGFFFIGARPVQGISTVSRYGDWRGVPPRFFDQIPGKDERSVSVWGEIPSIPATPPEFTQAERAGAASYWR